MAEMLISQFIDRQGFKSDADFAIANLSDVEKAFLKLNGLLSSGLGGGGKEISATITAAATATKGLTEAVTQQTIAVKENNTVNIAATKVKAQLGEVDQSNIKKLNDYRAALAANSEAQKQALKDVQAGKINADEYRFTLTKLTEQQFKYKQAISEATKEIKNQVQASLSPQDSIAGARAANKGLTSRRDSLSTTDPASVALIAKLNAEIDKNNDLINANSDALAKQKINVGNYQGSAKIIVDALQKQEVKLQNLTTNYTSFGSKINAQKTIVAGFGGAVNSTEYSKAVGELKKLEKEYEATAGEINTTRTVVEGFRRVTEKPAFLNLAAAAGDTTKELRFFTKQLNELEDAGLKNDQVYKDVQARLAGLQDQLGDTRAEVAALASDTRGFDLFAGAVEFAADSFQTLAGATVLFGGSEEDAAEATATLTAIQSISNGVKGIATELTTKGTFANKIFAFSQTQVATAFDVTATAAARLKAALITIGIGALIVGLGLLITNFSKIKDFFTGATDASKRFAEQQARITEFNNEVTQSVAKESVELAILKAKIEDTSLPMKVRIANVKDLQELYPQYFKDLKQEDILNGNAAAAYDLAAKAILRKAKASAAAKQLEILAEKELAVLQKEKEDAQTAGDQINQLRDNNATVGEGGFTGKGKSKVIQSITEEYAERRRLRDAEKADLQKNQQFFIDQVVKNTDLTKEQIKTGETKVKADKANNDKAKKDFADYNAERLKIEREINIERIRAAIQYYESVTANEKESLASRIAFIGIAKDANSRILKIQLEEELAAISEKEKKEAAQKGLSQKQITQIHQLGTAERLKAEEKYGFAVTVLNQKAIEDSNALLKAQADLIKDSTVKGPEKLSSELPQFIKDLQLKSDAETASAQKTADEKLAIEKQFQDKVNELAFEGLDTIASFVNASFDKKKNLIQDEIDAVEKQKQADIDRVNATTLSEQDKAAKLTSINIKAQADREALERRQREIDQKKAVFEKAVNIARIIGTTALAVIGALAPPPVGAGPIAGVPLAAVIGAIGALQIAQVLATPIPKFRTGKTSSYEGAAIVGDGGVPEYIYRADGTIEKTPAKDTLTYLGAKDIVFPDQLALLKAFAMPTFSGLIDKPKDNGTDKIVGRLAALESAIMGKTENHFHWDNGQLIKSQKNGQAYTEWVSRNT
jgi:hypothetical protein